MDTRYCPQCGQANASNFRFCQHCGAALADASAQPVPASAENASGEVAPRATSLPPVRPSPATPRFQKGAIASQQPIGQIGTGGISATSIWGPFAGFGERGRHVSWLLDDLGDRAEKLRQAVTDRFRKREIPGGGIEFKTLTGKGVAVEKRPYYLVRRGIATVGLHIARFGQDLYISQVTYAKGPINPLRVLILVLMLAFQAYIIFGYTNSLESALGGFDLLGGYSGGNPDALGRLLCCVGPLGALNTLALGLGAVHAIYKFVTDRDPLALLRAAPNEFEQDDIIALEKAVEETVRQSLDSVGIDSRLMPPAAEYGVKQRLI